MLFSSLVAWSEIIPSTIRKSWKKILPLSITEDINPSEESENSQSKAAGIIADISASEMAEILQGKYFQLNEEDIQECIEEDQAAAYDEMTDDEILEHLKRSCEPEDDNDSDDSEDKDRRDVCAFSNSEAMKAFQTVLEWLKCHPETSLLSLEMLRVCETSLLARDIKAFSRKNWKNIFVFRSNLSARSLFVALYPRKYY